jgi:hypothetical protein
MLNKNIKEIIGKPNFGFGFNTWEITRTKLQTSIGMYLVCTSN